MHIGSSNLEFNDEAVSNIISTILLMVIFMVMVLSAVSFAVPLLGSALAVADMQKAKDILSSLDTSISTDAQGKLEYRLYNGYLSGENHGIDLEINYSSNNSIYRTVILSSSALSYRQVQGYPPPSISYIPETSLQNGNMLHLALLEIEYDLVPYPGYHRIRFNSHPENSSFTGEFTVHIRDHQYKRSRYFFNISRIDLEIRKISVWDEEWRG